VREPFKPDVVPPMEYVTVAGVGVGLGVGVGTTAFVSELPPPQAVNRNERPANMIAKNTFFISTISIKYIL